MGGQAEAFIWSLLVVGIVCFIWFYIVSTGNKNRKIEIDRKVAEAQGYLDQIKNTGLPPVIDVSLLLNSAELAYLYEANATFYEPRAVRRSEGVGIGARVIKGISIGGYSGTSRSHQEWRRLDEGGLVLTNQRVLFNGKRRGESRSLKIDKMISIDAFTDGFEIGVEGRGKATRFVVTNPFLWVAMIKFVHQVNQKDSTLLAGKESKE